jgi:hypothetical protein
VGSAGRRRAKPEEAWIQTKGGDAALGADDVEKRSVSLELGEFGYDALEEQVRSFGISLGDFVRAAGRYYLADLGSKRAATRVPRFRERPGLERVLSVDLELEESAWRALEGEASRQDVSVERLLEHAVFYLLADLDAGRVTTRILESSERGTNE